MTITVESLGQLHTRLLLKGLRSKRASDSRFCKTLESIFEDRDLEATEGPFGDDHEIVEAIHLGGGWTEESTVTIAELKAELAKRPHVPNKQESVVLRKAKQQKGRNKGRRDR